MNLQENSDLLLRYDMIQFVKEIIQTGRLGIHSRISPLKTVHMFNDKPLIVLVFFFIFPIALLLAIHDRNITGAK